VVFYAVRVKKGVTRAKPPEKKGETYVPFAILEYWDPCFQKTGHFGVPELVVGTPGQEARKRDTSPTYNIGKKMVKEGEAEIFVLNAH